MTLSRTTLSFGVAMLVASGALAQKVTTDYAKGTDFAQYKTFTWIKEPDASSPLINQRIIDDVNAALSAKGLTLVSGAADLAIAAHAATQKQKTLDTFYDNFGGGWRWRGGFGSATTTVTTFTVGTLVIDIFDGHTKDAIWRGTATKTLSDNPEKNSTNLNKAIAKMFQRFPPVSNKASD